MSTGRLWWNSRVSKYIKNTEKTGTKEYREMATWLDGKIDPEYIDIGMINVRLGLLSEYIREYEAGE
jgi:hypothetical protein